jgi:hypothetical protein
MFPINIAPINITPINITPINIAPINIPETIAPITVGSGCSPGKKRSRLSLDPGNFMGAIASRPDRDLSPCLIAKVL